MATMATNFGSSRGAVVVLNMAVITLVGFNQGNKFKTQHIQGNIGVGKCDVTTRVRWSY